MTILDRRLRDYIREQEAEIDRLTTAEDSSSTANSRGFLRGFAFALGEVLGVLNGETVQVALFEPYVSPRMPSESYFKQFWERYPRRGRKAPAKAKEALKKARSRQDWPGDDAVLAAVRLYASYVERPGAVATMYAQGWINCKRWEEVRDIDMSDNIETKAPSAADERRRQDLLVGQCPPIPEGPPLDIKATLKDLAGRMPKGLPGCGALPETIMALDGTCNEVEKALGELRPKVLARIESKMSAQDRQVIESDAEYEIGHSIRRFPGCDRGEVTSRIHKEAIFVHFKIPYFSLYV